MTDSGGQLEDRQLQLRNERYALQCSMAREETLVRDRQELEDHNRELQNINNYLRGEVADLRAQVSYATQTLTARIQEQVDSARTSGVSEGVLRKTKGQRRREAREARQRRAAERLAARTSPGPGHAAGGAAEQRQTQQQATQNAPDPSPVAPTVPDVTVKEEQDDSVMVLDAVEKGRVPGLPLLESRHLNFEVA